MNRSNNLDQKEIDKFSQLAAEWWQPEGELRTLHEINPARLDFIVKQVDLSKQRVLDLGCGGGILAEAMAKAGAGVTGIDADAQAIAAARAHSEEQGLSIDYQCSTIEDFSAEPFDVITCMEMLEHVPDPAAIVTEAARLLKPGGWLILSTISRTAKAYALAILAAEYIFGILPRQTHDYNKFILPSELAAMIRASDLEMVEIAGLDYNPLTRHASLSKEVSVNYLVACRRLA